MGTADDTAPGRLDPRTTAVLDGLREWMLEELVNPHISAAAAESLLTTYMKEYERIFLKGVTDERTHEKAARRSQ